MGQTLNANASPQPKVPREEAIRRIREQIEIGRAIKDTTMYSMIDLDNAQKRRAEWLEDHTHMLTSLFSDSFLVEENSMDISSDIDNAITFGLKEKYFKDDINEQIGRLESFLERLKQESGENLMEQLMRQDQPKEIQPEEVRTEAAEKPFTDKLAKRTPPQEPSSIEDLPEGEPSKEMLHGKGLPEEQTASAMVSDQSEVSRDSILVINGQDGTARGSVLEFIERLGLRALTSREQANGANGLIEKFRETSNIHFAIVLLTADDATSPPDKAGVTSARGIHDVMFQFGYAVAKLGHKRVCALCQEGTEVPFHSPGVVFIPMDSRGGWKLLVAKQIEQARVQTHPNKPI